MKITKESTTHAGIYKNVHFEIVYHYIPRSNNIDARSFDKGWWTYYISINLEDLPDRINPDSFWLPFENISNSFMDYRYTDHKILNEIYFYGGITFYSKSSGLEEGNPKIIKVGCDFAHLCDLDRHYSVEDIQEHVKVTIDSLYEVIPEYGKELEVNNEK